MRLSQLIARVVILAPSVALCSSIPVRGIQGAGLEIQQRGGGAADIVGAIVRIVNQVKKIIGATNQAQHDQESAYTQSVVADLRNQYPEKNVVIYHNQDSSLIGINIVCHHTELDLVKGPQTQGYEVCVFDSGTFTLVGDGGYLNWCISGVFVRDGNTVTCSKIEPPEQPPPAPPAAQPIPPPQPVRKTPGATDGNYFVNCQAPDGTVSSGMAYYSKVIPGSNIGQQPNDYVDATHGTNIHWETSSSVTFPSTGTVVTWNILGGSEDAARDSSVGTADNGYISFWVYKGGGERLYTVDGWQCDVIYWSF